MLQLLHNKTKKLYHISINLAISLAVCICNHSFYESSLYLYKILFMPSHSIRKLDEYITYINHSTDLSNNSLKKKLCRKITTEIWRINILGFCILVHAVRINFHNKAPKGEEWTRRMNTKDWCVPFVGIAPISNFVSQNLWDVWSYLALMDANCDGLSSARYGGGQPYEYPVVYRV